MKSILHFFLIVIVLIANYSYGRSISGWSTITDPSFINECLKKIIRHINLDQNLQVTVSEVSNIVCTTQINNGVNIKLIFDHQQQTWECSLYKSPVEILGIQYEQCKQIEKRNLIEQIQQPNKAKSNDKEDDDEAKIDRLRQGNVDETNQDLNNKQNNDEQDHNKNTNNNEKKSDVHNSEQDTHEDYREIPNDNTNNNGSKPELNNQQKLNDEEQGIDGDNDVKQDESKLNLDNQPKSDGDTNNEGANVNDKNQQQLQEDK